jgi:hypothetical protein
MLDDGAPSTGERAGLDSHERARLEVGQRLDLEGARGKHSQLFDLVMLDAAGLTIEADNLDDAGSSDHREACLAYLRTNKDVTGNEGQLMNDFAVAPLAFAGVGGQKGFVASIAEDGGYRNFSSGFDMSSNPRWSFQLIRSFLAKAAALRVP